MFGTVMMGLAAPVLSASLAALAGVACVAAFAALVHVALGGAAQPPLPPENGLNPPPLWYIVRPCRS